MKFNKHDANVTLGLARCGTMTYQNLKDLGYSDSRIKNRSCGSEKHLIILDEMQKQEIDYINLQT